ncbi:MAG: MBL fold metallo-hydrolase [Bullifex sp.]
MVTPFFHPKGMTTNYIVTDEESKNALLIDCTDVDMSMINFLERGKYTLQGVLITHAHDNHAGGLKKLMRVYSPSVYACLPAVQGMKTNCLYGIDSFDCSVFHISILHIPGHSADGLVYVVGSSAFTGDVRKGSGRTHRNDEMLINGIRDKLLSLPDDTVIYPGHGPVSTVAVEKRFSH